MNLVLADAIIENKELSQAIRQLVWRVKNSQHTSRFKSLADTNLMQAAMWLEEEVQVTQDMLESDRLKQLANRDPANVPGRSNWAR